MDGQNPICFMVPRWKRCVPFLVLAGWGLEGKWDKWKEEGSDPEISTIHIKGIAPAGDKQEAGVTVPINHYLILLPRRSGGLLVCCFWDRRRHPIQYSNRTVWPLPTLSSCSMILSHGTPILLWARRFKAKSSWRLPLAGGGIFPRPFHSGLLRPIGSVWLISQRIITMGCMVWPGHCWYILRAVRNKEWYLRYGSGFSSWGDIPPTDTSDHHHHIMSRG